MRTESWFQRLNRWGLDDFLTAYGGLRLIPRFDGQVQVSGLLAFTASAPGREIIDDQYSVEILVPFDFPRSLPAVRETTGRIPRSFHTNPDGTLCLGSPTRLRLSLSSRTSLKRFVTKCVVPYLYGHAYFERHQVMPFSELLHGESGVFQDLGSLYGTSSDDSVVGFVGLTALSKRVANKAPCPCGSGRRLGRCHSRRVNCYRRCLGRAWFRGLLSELRASLMH